MVFAASAAAAGMLPIGARAEQSYPSRPVRFVLPFAAAGVADITARVAAEKLGDKLGQRFVVENQPGPGGIAAARAVLSQAPDGYTIGLVTNGTSISAAIYRALSSLPPARIPNSRRSKTSSRLRARSLASSMSAPSMLAARRTLRRTSPSGHSIRVVM